MEEKRYWVWCDSCGVLNSTPEGEIEESAAEIKTTHDVVVAQPGGAPHPKAELQEVES